MKNAWGRVVRWRFLHGTVKRCLYKFCSNSACVRVVAIAPVPVNVCEACMQHYMIAVKLVPVTPEEVE